MSSIGSMESTLARMAVPGAVSHVVGMARTLRLIRWEFPFTIHQISQGVETHLSLSRLALPGLYGTLRGIQDDDGASRYRQSQFPSRTELLRNMGTILV